MFSIRKCAAAIAAASAVALAGPALAQAGTGGTADCIHGSFNLTSLAVPLPVNNPSTEGAVVTEYLYRSDGRTWVYTNHWSRARSLAGGIWYHNGYNVDTIRFSLQPGSGAYLLLQRIDYGGRYVKQWVNVYENHPGLRATSYCRA